MGERGIGTHIITQDLSCYLEEKHRGESPLKKIALMRTLCSFPLRFNLILLIDLQVRDFRPDWDLEVNQPVAGNYYPVCFIFPLEMVEIVLYMHIAA